MVIGASVYTPRSIIDTSLALFRHTNPESILEDMRPYLIRDGLPHEYRRREFADLKTAFRALAPFTLARAARHLFLEGKDGSYCAYSNKDTGAGGTLILPAHARIRFDSLSIVNQEPFGFYSEHKVQKAFEMMRGMMSHKFFLLYYIRSEEGVEQRRTIRLTDYVERPLDVSTSGGVLPFENERDYRCLKKGRPPDAEVLNRLINNFGWPTPRSREFVDFIKTIELYEYSYEDQSMLLPKSAEQELLTFPAGWELAPE